MLKNNAHNDQYLIKAKTVAAANYNMRFGTMVDPPLAHVDEFYIVWFAKTLQNWKALVSSDVIAGQYWEVTYDGNNEQTYVDAYVRATNTCFSDMDYSMMQNMTLIAQSRLKSFDYRKAALIDSVIKAQEMIASGHTVSQIAALFDVSESTIRNILKRNADA